MLPSTDPHISVVVPFHGRQADLAYCLDALHLSEHDSFEVVVVDDGSPAPLTGIPNCICHATRQGPSAARNTGVRSARGDILVFIDSDVIVSPSTLRAFEKAMHETGCDAVQACYTYPGIADNLATRFLEDFQEYKIHSLSSPEIRTLRGGCFAVKKERYLLVGGFDENFREPSQEDTDLGRRLALSGGRILLFPSIRVLHNRPIDNLWVLWFRYYKMLKSMVKLHLRTFLEGPTGKPERIFPENTMSRSDQFARPMLSLGLLLSFFLFTAYVLSSGNGWAFPIPAMLCVAGYLFVNAPFLRFILQNRTRMRHLAGESFALAGMHVSLLLAIVSALAEFPWKRY